MLSSLRSFPKLLSHKSCFKLVSNSSRSWLRPLSHKLVFSGMTLFGYDWFSRKIKCEEGKFQLNAESSKVVANRERLIIKTRWEEVVDAFWHVLRFFQLWLIFLPPILTLPLVFFKNTEKLWYDMFVTAVERAGVVWIKAFQYLSHRRDIIGP